MVTGPAVPSAPVPPRRGEGAWSFTRLRRSRLRRPHTRPARARASSVPAHGTGVPCSSGEAASYHRLYLSDRQRRIGGTFRGFVDAPHGGAAVSIRGERERRLA